MSEAKPIIIVQARTGSTRLPGKVLKPFYRNESILAILLSKLTAVTGIDTVLATTFEPADDALEHQAREMGVNFFRGSENNVLERFIACAEYYHAETIVRVCADNPFLDIDFLKQILRRHLDCKPDYTSFALSEGTPAIRTHFGVFCEVVELKTLKKVASLTKEDLYREHVTNYIYTHPEIFKCEFLTIPEAIASMPVRLTLDTPEDWHILSELYQESVEQEKDFTTVDVLQRLKQHPDWIQVMKEQIEKFSK